MKVGRIVKMKSGGPWMVVDSTHKHEQVLQATCRMHERPLSGTSRLGTWTVPASSLREAGYLARIVWWAIGIFC